MTNFYGLDYLRKWLESQGFRVSQDYFQRDNGCNWYAYRRSELPARECECNGGETMQIVVRPHLFRHASAPTPSGAWESVEVGVTGEANGMWFRLMAYSLKPEELRERLPEIEAALIAAWNALKEPT
jgi:hypothetical protein